jgi:2'-hydroxyisoflavone reductase
MNLLILGGTLFLGRHLSFAALARGHRVTHFNRGQHAANDFPGVETIKGDRDGDLVGLESRYWDAVIDTSGYIPRVVAASAALLADKVRHYTFISSVSVYAGFHVVGQDESAAVGMLEDSGTEAIDGATYGPLKAACEDVVTAALPGRALNIRPGLIVGPDDPTDRFTYWPVRVRRGGSVLAPGRPDAPVQLIDVRDLASWTIGCIENDVTGTFNVTGPASRLSLSDVLLSSLNITGSGATIEWVGESFLTDNEVAFWSELPLCVGSGEDHAGFMAINCRKALAYGLAFRPLEETIRDTLAWFDEQPVQRALRAGLSAEREAELLAQWHARSNPQQR